MKTLSGRLDTNSWNDYTLDGVEIDLDEFLGQQVILVAETTENAPAPLEEWPDPPLLLEEWPDEPTRKEGKSAPPERQ